MAELFRLVNHCNIPRHHGSEISVIKCKADVLSLSLDIYCDNDLDDLGRFQRFVILPHNSEENPIMTSTSNQGFLMMFSPNKTDPVHHQVAYPMISRYLNMSSISTIHKLLYKSIPWLTTTLFLNLPLFSIMPQWLSTNQMWRAENPRSKSRLECDNQLELVDFPARHAWLPKRYKMVPHS